MANTSAAAAAPKINTSKTAAGEYLLERLKILLTRLQSTTDILQKWPEASADSAKVHAETATELINSIRQIVKGIRTIERHVNGPSAETTTPSGIVIPKESMEIFRKTLDEKCPIPLDLLDLLDVGLVFGTNPQVYARGLMKESVRQLSGLERRKRGLGMLADAIERGMAENEAAAGTSKMKQENGNECMDVAGDSSNKKRKREETHELDPVSKKERVGTDS